MEKEKQEGGLSKEQEYKVGNISFIVNSVFKDNGINTLTSALINLMKKEIEKV